MGDIHLKFIRKPNGKVYGPYAYEYRSVREGNRVRSVYVRYIGKISPEDAKKLKPETVRVAEERKTWRDRVLERRTDFSNGTQLWVEPETPADEVEDLRSSFERLPARMRQQAVEIQVFNGPGERFTRGGRIFDEGGHFESASRVVRVFTGGPGSSRWVKNFRSADFIMVHEVAHATYDKYVRLAANAMFAARETFMQHVPELRKRVVTGEERAQKKWQPRSDRAEREWTDSQKRFNEIAKKYDEWRDTHTRATGRADDVQNPYTKPFEEITAERHAKADAYYKAQRELERAKLRARQGILGTYRDRGVSITPSVEDAALTMTYREEAAKAPGLLALLEFGEATKEEGGLTVYSNAYREERKDLFFTENFAEATKSWYSTVKTVRTPKASVVGRGRSKTAVEGEVSIDELKRTYPKTYDAWSRVMEVESEGHAVPLRERPKERKT